MTEKRDAKHVVHAIIVHQWLEPWESVSFDGSAHMAKPNPHFYLFTLPARQLVALCDIQRRTTAGGLPRRLDTGIQRKHDRSRSAEIQKYVQYGYPWSELSQSKRESGEFQDLRKPGWLPTAVVVNMLNAGDRRGGMTIDRKDAVSVADDKPPTGEERPCSATIAIPEFHPEEGRLAPFEVIDGQHRLYAFAELDPEEMGEFELPVVAFHGLDISWQAYLFWTINIKPKPINPSLAFDLFPLLRQEEWLERFHGHSIYRETRAQELTAQLWSYPDSPWHGRIDMLGDRGREFVSQNAWVRSLYAAFVKSWEGRGVRGGIGGLFGAPVGQDKTVLPWGIAEQAAFLIYAWQQLETAIKQSDATWACALRAGQQKLPLEPNRDQAFAGPHSLLNTDQGVRGYLYVVNDLCFVAADRLKLTDWATFLADDSLDPAEAADLEEDETASRIAAALQSFSEHPVGGFVQHIATSLAEFDWRTSDDPGLREEERTQKLALRGSGGYRELRRILLKHLAESESSTVADAAKDVQKKLGLY